MLVNILFSGKEGSGETVSPGPSLLLFRQSIDVDEELDQSLCFIPASWICQQRRLKQAVAYLQLAPRSNQKLVLYKSRKRHVVHFTVMGMNVLHVVSKYLLMEIV